MIHTRTIREAAVCFKERDPQTCLTETAIRTLVRSGQVPSVKVGKKYLVAIEALEDYLAGKNQNSVMLKESEDSCGGAGCQKV